MRHRLSRCRAGGYRIPDIQNAVTAVRDLNEVSNTITALETRLETIAHCALALLRAGTLLAETKETAWERERRR